MKNKIFALPLLVLVLCLFIGATPGFAYITVKSAPVFSADTSDTYLYFQGPDDLFYKIPSTSSEIVIASDNTLNPFPDPVPWDLFQDRTASFATKLGTEVTIYSSPAVPGDGWCYFQGAPNYNYNFNQTLYSLSKIRSDGTGFSDFNQEITTTCAPAALGGSIYFFSFVDPTTGTPVLSASGANPVPNLFQISGTAQEGRSATNLRQQGLSTPYLSQAGSLYFQGSDNRLLSMPAATSGTATAFGATIKTLSTPFVSVDSQGIANNGIYFQGASPFTQQLCSVNLTTRRFVSQQQKISTSPYVGNDHCLYFLDTDNNMYQYRLADTSFNPHRLYIQALSAPVSYDNGDGTITLFFQGPGNKLMKFTVSPP